MLLFRGISDIILLFIIQSIVGTKEENTFSDGDYSSANGGSDHNNVDIFPVNGTSNDSDAYVNYVKHKFDALSNNGMINIMADVKLLSVVLLRGLHNISIIGHDNPTVSCDSAGGIHFEHCCNCTIRGIILEKCGTTNGSKQPAVMLYNSSDITIQNCTFQHSITQALVISEVAGNININGCKFSFNNKFKGHGAAIYYLPKIKHHSEFRLTISNCIFTHNAMSGDSVVYISSSHNKSRERVLFTNFEFLNNRGIPLYISHQTVFASEKILFKGNVGNESGGIFITNRSNVIFHTSDSKFVNNKALHDGGALHIEGNSDVIFEENSTLTIDDNNATYGGALYIVYNSNVTFKGNSTVTINNNKATDHGGALCILSNSGVNFQGNSTITINSNTATYGGALYAVNNSHVTFEGNLEVKINKNQAIACGGAIAVFDNSDITGKGNTAITINGNDVTDYGGALIIYNNSSTTFEKNSIIIINKNRAKGGGAIYIEKNSDITFKGKSRQTIDNNQARYGAAIYIYNNSVATFTGDSTAIISNNKQAHQGGAFSIDTDSGVTFKGNCTAIINHNQAYFGGAFHIQSNSDVTFEGSSVVTINNNQATEDGGGILTWNNSAIIFDQTSTVIINNNEARNDGGAICLLRYCDLTLKMIHK